MSNVTKLMLVFMVGTMVLLTAGCGGGGGDDTVANVAGVWSISLDGGNSEESTLLQNGHELTLVDSGDVIADGEIYGRSVTFELEENDSGTTVDILMELTLDSEESPSSMTGTVKAMVDGRVIITYTIVCLKI